MNGWIRQWMVGLVWRAGLALAGINLAAPALAQEAEWIWSPGVEKEKVGVGDTAYFRKAFTMRSPEAGQITIAADDTYELFVNGRRVGVGEATKKLDEHDITRFLLRGNNIIAVKALNRTGSTAALVARVTVKDFGGRWEAFSTDESWRVNSQPLPLWHTSVYNDRAWAAAQSFGPLNATAPWDRREEVPKEEVSRTERFTINPNFEVQQVLPGDQTGSLTAMTFNEFGHILASREGEGLLLIYDGNNDKIPEKVRTYCDKVVNIQGILALNGEVYVTGEGPDGPGLYRLADKDRDGVLESVRTLVKFKNEVLEHGAHAVVLGPDGLLYVLLGNHATVDGEHDVQSPYRDTYEGDLVTPRYEDPGGHAAGIKAPGGAVIRTDTEGSGVQIVAGGLRNPYDMAFNREGELFIHDADMESDEGMTWYRPTRLLHVVPGGEYGWRSGWAKWPDYYVDSLPPMLETGRGSPAGITVYNHVMFPARFHGTIFTADWAQGRILAIKPKKNGASFTASSEVFLEGNPLNVTDLEVGPDGWLYFVTGGRGTAGGIYRVTWKGQVPAEVANIGTGLAAIIRQPQLQASYSRQNIAALRKQMGPKWDKDLIGVAKTAANPVQYRLQALDLMQLYGPQPTPELLIELSKAPNELVRAKAAELMGLQASGPSKDRLVELITDDDRSVRRRALESLVRCGHSPPVKTLLTPLASDDRFEAWAARRLLERIPENAWREAVLSSEDHRVLIQGGLALVIAHPTRENAQEVLQKFSAAITKFVSDKNFVDMLRVAEVAMIRGQLGPGDVPELQQQLADEFPSGDPLMNRELIRLLVHLQEAEITSRYLAYLRSEAADVDKLHVAMHLRFLDTGWTVDQRMELLSYYEAANKRKGGGSYARYIINATRDFCLHLSEEEARQVLVKGDKWPNAALGALYKLPQELGNETRQELLDLDARLAGQSGDSVQRLQVGIMALLARSGDAASMTYLRGIWEKSPERRPAVAMGLAQQPGGENWTYLIRSLPILEPAAAREVCAKLTMVEVAPEEPEAYRQAILVGLKMRQKDPEVKDAAQNAIGLLTFWTGEELAATLSEDKQLEAWQKWFAAKYPDHLDARLPTAADNAKYSFEELLTHLGSDEAKGQASRGADVYLKAQCAKCHRFDNKGESLGPDLTTVGSRFSRRELLEAILFPSHVISSQYASKTIRTTDGRQITGLVLPGGGGDTIVLQPNGERLTLAKADIDQTKPSKISSMPAGLLDSLTAEEIADLFAYLQRTSAPSLSRRPAETQTK